MDKKLADDVEDSLVDANEKSSDFTSNEGDNESSSYRSDSVSSPKLTKYSHQLSRVNLSVSSKSDRYTKSSYNEKIPSVESECHLLDLLTTVGYPMTQVNGQRKLGPPPGWSKAPPDSSCEIFVGKLPRDLYEDEIYPIFDSVGEVYEVRLMMDFSGTNRGYCFIMYTKSEYAQRAIKELNNYEISKGRKIGVVASVNNCRLCINQLPPTIDSKIVIEKFHDLTDDVSNVAVYRKPNGDVRYALVSYKTHRGAAMARRRLLPERGNLFERSEVSIDWANPSMTPNNVIEESGTLDDSGNLKFSSNPIGQFKRGGYQRRGRGVYLEKNTNVYYRDKSMEQNMESQRGNFHFDRRRGQRAGSNHRKPFTNETRGRGSNKENLNFQERAENRSRSFPVSSNENYSQLRTQNGRRYEENHDMNGNLSSMRNLHQIPPQVVPPVKNDEIIPQGQESIAQDLMALATNFVPECSQSFNVFEPYPLSPNVKSQGFLSPVPNSNLPGAICWGGSVPNFFQTPENQPRQFSADFSNVSRKAENSPSPQFNKKIDQKCSNFAEFGRWNSTESFVPTSTMCLTMQQNDSLKNGRHQRKIFENPKTTNRPKNLLNERALNQITNWYGQNEGNQENSQAGNFYKNRTGSMIKENKCYPIQEHNICLDSSLKFPFSSSNSNFCQVCASEVASIQQQNRHFGNISGQQEFNGKLREIDNTENFRGFNGFVNNPICLIDRVLAKQETRFPPSGQPQSSFSTSSFADYQGLLQQSYQNYPSNSQTNLRPILSRLSLKNGEDV